MSINLIQKLFAGNDHTKLHSSKKLNKQLDKFSNTLAGDIDNGVNIIKWNRMIDDSGYSAKVIIVYDDNRVFAPSACPLDEPINLSPKKFSIEILNRLADKLNIGDGNHAGDIQLIFKDSNVSNPFDHNLLTTQAQLAFEVTLKDLNNEKDK